MSETSGSSGLGSVSKEQIDSSTLEMVRAGLHSRFKMSMQIPPARKRCNERSDTAGNDKGFASALQHQLSTPQTDKLTRVVDVAVVDLGLEPDLWRLERIVGGKRNLQNETDKYLIVGPDYDLEQRRDELLTTRPKKDGCFYFERVGTMPLIATTFRAH